MTEKFDYALIDAILESHASSPTAIIAVLQDIQEHFRYLPHEVFPYLSKRLHQMFEHEASLFYLQSN